MEKKISEKEQKLKKGMLDRSRAQNSAQAAVLEDEKLAQVVTSTAARVDDEGPARRGYWQSGVSLDANVGNARNTSGQE